jgi:hypothetical protein
MGFFMSAFMSDPSSLMGFFPAFAAILGQSKGFVGDFFSAFITMPAFTLL